MSLPFYFIRWAASEGIVAIEKLHRAGKEFFFVFYELMISVLIVCYINYL